MGNIIKRYCCEIKYKSIISYNPSLTYRMEHALYYNILILILIN